jgi:hypothetical protein
MAFTVTPSRRRLAMGVMLLLALSGGFIRKYAPNPSTLRDVGSLLLVMWLPAVGNLIGYLMRKIPRRAPPRTEFEADTAFVPHLQVLVEAAAVQADVLNAIDPAERKCTVLVGRHGFTARLAEPLKQTFAAAGPQTLALELLHPAVALPRLGEATEFHLLVGNTGIAKGRVMSAAGQR